jgi:hypothetical protein
MAPRETPSTTDAIILKQRDGRIEYSPLRHHAQTCNKMLQSHSETSGLEGEGKILKQGNTYCRIKVSTPQQKAQPHSRTEKNKKQT